MNKTKKSKLIKLGHLTVQWLSMLILLVLALNGAQAYWQGNEDVGAITSFLLVGLLLYANKR